MNDYLIATGDSNADINTDMIGIYTKDGQGNKTYQKFEELHPDIQKMIRHEVLKGYRQQKAIERDEANPFDGIAWNDTRFYNGNGNPATDFMKFALEKRRSEIKKKKESNQMAKKSAVQSVRVNQKVSVKKVKAVAPPLAPPPPMPELDKESQEALTKSIRAKYEYISNTIKNNSDFRGMTSKGEMAFGDPLDGFTEGAIASLKSMAGHELGSPKVAELFEGQPVPQAQPMPTIINRTIQPQVQVQQQQSTPVDNGVDVLDIFGVK